MNTRTRDPLATAIVVLFFLVTIFCIIYAIATDFFSIPEPIYYQNYTVRPYDTLWNIASISDGYGRLDTRVIIDAIQEASEVGDTIYVGQTIYIPMYNN